MSCHLRIMAFLISMTLVSSNSSQAQQIDASSKIRYCQTMSLQIEVSNQEFKERTTTFVNDDNNKQTNADSTRKFFNYRGEAIESINDKLKAYENYVNENFEDSAKKYFYSVLNDCRKEFLRICLITTEHLIDHAIKESVQKRRSGTAAPLDEVFERLIDSEEEAGSLTRAEGNTLKNRLKAENEAIRLATSQPESPKQRVRRTITKYENAYSIGKVNQVKGDLINFELGKKHDVRVGDLLAVQRPFDAGQLVCEVKVLLVQDGQACARAPENTVKLGDGVIFQKILAEPNPDMNDLRGKDVEITFTKSNSVKKFTFVGRLSVVEFSGPMDISHVQLFLLPNTYTRTRYQASSISQLKVNGILFVLDPEKNTLVPSDIMPIREKLRAEERRIHELRLAQIEADKHVRLAEVSAKYNLTQARAEAAEARARAEQAEQEAFDWKRKAMYAANSEETSGGTGIGRGLKFASGLFSAASGAVAIYSGGVSLESGASIAGGAASMWDAVSGK